MASIKDMMDESLDPKKIELQTKYGNARIAVDLAYKYAQNLVPHERISDAKSGKKEYIEYTYDERIVKLVEIARLLKPSIEADLNSTLSVLDTKPEVKHGSKSATA